MKMSYKWGVLALLSCAFFFHQADRALFGLLTKPIQDELLLTDVQIAQSAKMEPIKEIAAKVGLSEDDLELYGKYKAKISLETIERLKDKKDGKLVLVTAINPTPAGEGKTTTMIGLAQSLNKIGKKTVVAMREPSLGPCFGVKGGAAGGGYAQVVPMEDINLHFTGDIHAITTANNLISAMLACAVCFCCAILNKMDFIKREIISSKPISFCSSHNLVEVLCRILRQPRCNNNSITNTLQTTEQRTKQSHIPKWFSHNVRARVLVM